MQELIQTVSGPIAASDLGRVLPHEHIPNPADIFAGSAAQPLDEKGRQIALDHIVPIYRRLIASHDCHTIVECTPVGKGGMVPLMQEISLATGMNLVCSTGYYLKRARPVDFTDRSAEDIADQMIQDLTEGIGDTGVRAGIIKIAIHDMQESDMLLCRAAAIAQKETGFSITTHACTPETRRSLVDLLDGLGVPPERLYIGHADNAASLPELLALVQRGFNVILTIWGIVNPKTLAFWPCTLPVPRYHTAGLVAGLVAEGYIDQVMFSVDASSKVDGAGLRQDLYDVGPSRTSRYLFEHDFWGMKDFGLGDAQLEHMMRRNPKRMLLGSASQATL